MFRYYLKFDLLRSKPANRNILKGQLHGPERFKGTVEHRPEKAGVAVFFQEESVHVVGSLVKRVSANNKKNHYLIF